MITKDKKQELLNKYQDHRERAEGGIFTKSGRERLLGIARPYGGDEDRTISNFWNRTVKYVKNALVDLELFIETAEKDKINEVITVETLSPVITRLLWDPLVYDEKPERIRAEISHLLILAGFRYLKNKTPRRLSLTEERTIDEAIDLSEHLSQYFTLEDER